MLTTLYSVMHFLEDGLCAYAMFSAFLLKKDAAQAVLFYNFCAFALQAPFGALMDCFSAGSDKKLFTEDERNGLCALFGVILTFAGVFTGPVLLGIGNALFHVGGGIGTIREDFRTGKGGRLLGIFVAPGALGLFLGTTLGKKAASPWILLLFLILFTCCAAGLILHVKRRNAGTPSAAAEKPGDEKIPRKAASEEKTAAAIIAAALCFLVVVIRSHVGMAVTFPWKTGFFISLLSVLCVVLGKVAGGFLNARFGTVKTVLVTLPAAAVCFFFSRYAGFGLPALFLFNMTMPVTLYLIVNRFRDYPGAMFGLLTLALFVGFLPTYYGCDILNTGNAAAVLSAVSAVMLAGAAGMKKRG